MGFDYIDTYIELEGLFAWALEEMIKDSEIRHTHKAVHARYTRTSNYIGSKMIV